MKKVFAVEEISKNYNLLFIDESQKNDTVLLQAFLSHFSKHLQVFLLSQKKVHFSHVRQLSTLGIHFLDKLKDDIPFTFIFLSNPKRKKTVYEEIAKLAGKETKILIVIPRRKVEMFLDIIESTSSHKNIYVVLLGDVFSESLLDLPFSKNIEKVLSNGKIVVYENELTELYPISFSDVLLGIDYILFSSISSGVLKLYYDIPSTDLAMANSLRRVEPDLSIDYTKNRDRKKEDVITENTLSKILGPIQDISSVFLGFEKSVKEFSDSTGTARTSQKKPRLHFARYSLGALRRSSMIIFGTFGLYLIASLICVFASMYFFKSAAANLNEGRIRESLQDVRAASTLYEIGSPPIKLIVLQGNVIYPNPTSSYLESYEDALSIVQAMEKELEKTLLTRDLLDPTEVDSIISSAFFLYFLTHDVNLGNFSFLNNNAFEKYIPLIPVAKEALGYGKTMRYLLLFQNDNELRPTGGFIGSVGYLEIESGSIEHMEIQDVYDIDGQLTEHVEPHFIIRRYLQPHLYLRDSNFHPDFEKSASSAAFLYNKASGKTIDGVIAIDTQVLKKVMEVVGPIQIPGQKEIFTKENIDVLIHESIHDDFFPGSQEKKQILSRVFNMLMASIEGDTQKQLRLIKALPQLFSEKHILLSFQEAALQKGITAAGIGGTFIDTRLTDGIHDTLSINEANIGVNKINSSVNRDVEYSVYLHDAEYSGDIMLKYENTGEEEYSMYLRVILPKSTLVESIAINSVVQQMVPAVTDPVFFERPGFRPPIGLEVDEEMLSDTLKSVGFQVVVAGSSEKRIRITTRNSIDGTLPASFSYSLQYIKQPGVLSYPLTVTFQADNRYKRIQSGSPVIYNGKINGDREFKVDLQKRPD